MTPRQREVLAAVVLLTEAYGCAPTVRELAEQLGINSSAAHKHLVRLRAAGAVEWDDGHNRTLRVL